jgi:hypothetical protein
MLVRDVHIPELPFDERGTVIRRRTKNMIKPRLVNAHDVGVGPNLYIAVTESSSYGKVCKEYRIVPDIKNEKVVLEKKDGCQLGKLVYEYVMEIPMDDHEDCFLEIQLKDDANSLTIAPVKLNHKLSRFTRDNDL